jgi:hypothetical protein
MTAPIYHARELADGSSSPVNDPSRVTRLNELIREAVNRHPGVVELYDLERALSPDGRYHQELNGETVRFDDGVHISAAGAALMAPTLLPQITTMAQKPEGLLSAAAPAGIR